MRPPLVKITDAEIVRIQDELMKAELLGTRTALGRQRRITSDLRSVVTQHSVVTVKTVK